MPTTTHPPQARKVEVYHALLDGGLADADRFTWVPADRPGSHGVGVEWLYTAQETTDGAEACIARYQPGAHSHLHEHLGYELILVLDGELLGGDGESYRKGTLVLEHPGGEHRLSSPNGCTALIVREKGVIVDLLAAPAGAAAGRSRPQ